jgi:hypothetical protein
MTMSCRCGPTLALLVTALAVAASACGPRVARLDLHDRRLPVEARRWLADAEDEVSIAQVELDEAEESLETAQEFKRYVDRHVNPRWPRSSSASGAREKLGQLARERITLARLELRAAEKQGDLARARLSLARAETAVRHDLRSYNLEPLKRAADGARAELAKVVGEVESQRAKVDQATTSFWGAYGAYVRSGGRNDVLWGWED